MPNVLRTQCRDEHRNSGRYWRCCDVDKPSSKRETSAAFSIPCIIPPASRRGRLRDQRVTPFLPSAARATVPDHLSRIDDLVEPLLVDVPGLERGLLQGQALVIGMVRDR